MLREGERREMELLHRAQLLESEARYADIVDSALEAIVTFGGDRRITLFNAAAERVFRCSAAQAVGTAIDRFFDPALDLSPGKPARGRGNGAAAARQRVVGAGGGGRARRRGPLPDGVLAVVAGAAQRPGVHADPARHLGAAAGGGGDAGAGGVARQHHGGAAGRSTRSCNRRTIELERAMGARSRFYANMSHELRTPINAILGYSSLLLDRIYGPLNDQQVNSIERTHKAANHLLELVNDILDLSKIEAGKMELQLESVGFPELIQDLFVTVAPFAEQHGVPLALETRSDPFTIVSDARRVRQILLNLLSNAIKFGGGKPVRVVSQRREGGGLRVEVVDQGDGIAPEDQEKIFDEFVQLEQPHSTQGTGLGLPISRRLAELLGGSLTVSSAPGEGSTFLLTLPQSDPELATMEAGERVAAGR